MQAQPAVPVDLPGVMDNFQEELLASAIRLPLAALLGTVLALRPRRGGTPERQPAVVQTQIILAVVGALIMLVVGASLARAFGIVGAANLIRYRSKIDDPKDAVVMLCALASGLAAGVGLYGLSVVGTLFIVFCLWIIEGFEPQTRIFEPIVRAIRGARKKIDIFIFRFDSEEIETALGGAVQRGVTVRALIAHTNRGGGGRLRKLEQRLLATGVLGSRTASDLSRYHAKYMIADSVLH